VIVDLLEIVNGQVVFVIPVILLENGCDFFLGLVSVGFCVHGLHELNETDAACFLDIEFCDDFIGGLPVGVEAVLRE
jgi:hypothetical protein